MQFVGDKIENFDGARLQYLAQAATGQQAWATATDTGNFDRLLWIDEAGVDAAVTCFENFSFCDRCTKADSDVVGEVISTRW